jgi:hypothetical protein
MVMDEFHTPMIEALAEARASIEGKSGSFHRGRRGEKDGGAYEGYCAEARELVRRLERRGYRVVRAPQ